MILVNDRIAQSQWPVKGSIRCHGQDLEPITMLTFLESGRARSKSLTWPLTHYRGNNAFLIPTTCPRPMVEVWLGAGQASFRGRGVDGEGIWQAKSGWQMFQTVWNLCWELIHPRGIEGTSLGSGLASNLLVGARLRVISWLTCGWNAQQPNQKL